MGMIDVSTKPDTLRVAIAEARITMSKQAIRFIKEGKSPKGNIVDAASVSATMAGEADLRFDTVLSSNSDR